MKKIVLVVSLALLTWVIYLWRDSKQWNRQVEEYDDLVGHGSRKEVQAKLESMRQDRPDDPDLLRREAKALAIENPPKALELLRRLRDSREATWQDLALLVEISQDYIEEPVERSILQELENTHSEQPEVVALLARQEFLESRLDDALQRLAQAPQHPAVRFQLARILLFSTDLVSRLKAKRILFELGKENTHVGLKALYLLMSRELGPGVFPEDLIDALQAIQRHPLTGDATYLRAASLHLQLAPDRRDEILYAAVETIHVRDEVLLAVWLNKEFAPDLVLEVLSSETAVREEACFHPYFQALLMLKKTKEARLLLDGADSLLDASSKMQANAYLLLAQGRKEEVFSRIVPDAISSGDQSTLLAVGRLALLTGHGEEAWKAYLQALVAGGEEIGQSVGLQLLQMALHRRETEVAWRIAKFLTERYPRRNGNRNNYSYLALLLDRDVAQATDSAEKVVKLVPGNSAFLSTLALARLKAGRLEEAFELMKRRGNRGLTFGERSTKVAILVGLDREEEARKIAQGLRPEMMLPEEWSLLGDFVISTPP
ncbi:MAG: hypothetical protein CMI30_02470 [Opitutae bacterium]|nr:hypothetical protein [Opitutae bacterium]|tara:strand:+ start:165 stop:1802 length:1638 start_codon:yes stop_codon:yes gene_type:complete